MVQYDASRLDLSFSALSDATRRGVLKRLSRSDESISVLAERFGMSLTGMKKHVQLLEQAGLVVTEKVGRVRICRLGPGAMDGEIAWMEGMRRLWAARFDALDAVLEDLKQRESADGRADE